MTAHIETAELHGQPVLKLQTPDGAVALISLFGAQVLSWVPAGGEDRLYLSPDAVFDGATPIRGGVPLCFPQFAGRGPLPKHGFARPRLWEVSNTRAGKDFALATLRLADDEARKARKLPTDLDTGETGTDCMCLRHPLTCYHFCPCIQRTGRGTVISP